MKYHAHAFSATYNINRISHYTFESQSYFKSVQFQDLFIILTTNTFITKKLSRETCDYQVALISVTTKISGISCHAKNKFQVSCGCHMTNYCHALYNIEVTWVSHVQYLWTRRTFDWTKIIIYLFFLVSMLKFCLIRHIMIPRRSKLKHRKDPVKPL